MLCEKASTLKQWQSSDNHTEQCQGQEKPGLTPELPAGKSQECLGLRAFGFAMPRDCSDYSDKGAS